MKMIYLIVNNSYHIIDEEIKKLVGNNKYEVIDYLKSSLEDIVMEANYTDLFLSKKIMVIKNAVFLSIKSDTKVLEKYFENPNLNTDIIFTCEEVDERLKIVKTIKDKFHYNIIKPLYQKEIVSRLLDIAKKNGYVLSIESATYISKSSLDNYDIAYNNLEKIFLYYSKPCKINDNDVINLVSMSLEENNFKFIDAVINKNINESFRILNDLKIKKIEPLSLFNLLAREYRLMLIVTEEYRNKSRRELLNILNIKDWQLDKLLKNASCYSMEELETKIVSLADYDYDIKVGKIDKWLALEMFILTI